MKKILIHTTCASVVGSRKENQDHWFYHDSYSTESACRENDLSEEKKSEDTEKNNTDSECLLNKIEVHKTTPLAQYGVSIGNGTKKSAVCVLDPRDGNKIICAVADGMGGFSYGKDTSRLALEYLANYLDHISSSDLSFINEINNELVDIRATYGLRMGTTLSMAKITLNEDGQAVAEIFNVGDSPIYHIHDEKIEQVAILDNKAAEDERDGKKLVYEDGHIVGSERLTNFLANPNFKERPFHCKSIELKPGDKLIIGSDGINSLDARYIRALAYAPVGNSAEIIVKEAENAANDHSDNVTAVVLSYISEIYDESKDGAFVSSSDGDERILHPKSKKKQNRRKARVLCRLFRRDKNEYR